MSWIVIAIIAAIAVVTIGILFVPGVGSALAFGVGSAFFKHLYDTRKERREARRLKWEKFRFRRRREPDAGPAPPDAPQPDAPQPDEQSVTPPPEPDGPTRRRLRDRLRRRR